MLASATARALRAHKRSLHRSRNPPADLRPRVRNPITGRMVLEYGSVHKRHMASGRMELPGGFSVIDGRSVLSSD